MNRIIATIVLSLGLLSLTAQQSTYSAYWHQRVSLFEMLPVEREDILFVGNSITDGGEWHELLQNPRIKNRGISGDISKGVLDRLPSLLKGRPKKIFLMIGVNDLAQGIAIDTIARNIEAIVAEIQTKSPQTKIYLQSVLPLSNEMKMFSNHTKRSADVVPLNDLLKKIATARQITYVDLYTHFVNPETGMLNLRYSNDGLHLMGAGYLHWATLIKPFVNKP